MDRERDEQGKYTEQVAPGDVLAVFREADLPVLTSKEVAEEMGIARQTAYNKLEELVEQGDLHKKKVGARAVVYISLPDGA